MGNPIFREPKQGAQKAQPYDGAAEYNEYDRELQEKLEGHIKRTKVSQEALAKEIGFTGPALSAWRRSIYTGNIGNLESKIRYFFEQQEGKTERAKKAQAYAVQTN